MPTHTDVRSRRRAAHKRVWSPEVIVVSTVLVTAGTLFYAMMVVTGGSYWIALAWVLVLVMGLVILPRAITELLA